MSDNTTSVKASELDRLEDRTDWERIRSLSDEEIEQAVENDPDQIMLDKEWFERARLVTPESEKKRIAIRLDDDIVDFFKQQGRGYQTRINKVLRAYMVAQKMKDENQS
jgi:uncharacterized protein (DUF4415 family)